MAKEYAKLRGRIVEKYGTQSEFARAINKTDQTVTAKLGNRSSFSQDDIKEWSDALDIDPDHIGEFFFTSYFQKLKV